MITTTPSSPATRGRRPGIGASLSAWLGRIEDSRRLRLMDDRLLRDIGLSRHAIDTATGRPSRY